MPRGGKKVYSGKQRAGTEYGGNVQQNGIQPRRNVEDLSPSNQASLIKRTGQNKKVDEPARARNWMGQTGEKPKERKEDRMPPPGYYE